MASRDQAYSSPSLAASILCHWVEESKITWSLYILPLCVGGARKVLLLEFQCHLTLTGNPLEEWSTWWIRPLDFVLCWKLRDGDHQTGWGFPHFIFLSAATPSGAYSNPRTSFHPSIHPSIIQRSFPGSHPRSPNLNQSYETEAALPYCVFLRLACGKGGAQKRTLGSHEISRNAPLALLSLLNGSFTWRK